MKTFPAAWRSTFVLGGIASAFLFALHCGSDNESTFQDNACETTFKGKCGGACQTDNECADGIHCANGLCTADCSPGQKCPNGATCSPRGRCGPDTGQNFLPPGSDDDSGTGNNSDACVNVNLQLGKTIPTVVLLVDRSSSMTTAQFPPGSGITRWDAVRNALIGDGGVIPTLESEVQFGLTTYSWDGDNFNECPQLTSVAFKLNNFNDIKTSYPPSTIDNTPTADSMKQLVGLDDAGAVISGGYAAATVPGPKILILATDGDPDQCTDPSNQPPAREYSVWASEHTHAAGIDVYVMAVGNDGSSAHQQEVSNVGQGKQRDGGALTTVFRPNNTAEVVTQLRTLINGVRSCKFTLNGSVNPGSESTGQVTLNGQTLTFGDPNGWKLNSPTELEVVGTACDTVKTTSNAQFSVVFPCNTVSGVN